MGVDILRKSVTVNDVLSSLPTYFLIVFISKKQLKNLIDSIDKFNEHDKIASA